jgi:holo-[acyl-carrier protein] synthase
MIAGIGIDLIEIHRIAESIEKTGERFLEKLFTPGEIAFCSSKVNPAQHYAARFAAKEAIYKSAPYECQQYLTWQSIEILTLPNGAPEVRLLGEGQKVNELGYIIKISLTHNRDTAACSAICIKE